MPGLSEILRALYGAYRLARFDAGGLASFDISIGGFWRSFFAAVLVLPLYLATLDVRFAGEGFETPWPRFLAIQMIGYVIGWIAYPLVMTTVARALDRERHYLRYIVAYNWTSVWQNLIYLPLAMLSLGGAVAEGPAAFLTLGALVVVLVYAWFVARTALDVPAPVAAALVALDIGLSLIITAVTDRLL